MAARVGGELEPAMGFADDLTGELIFRLAELLEVGPGSGGFPVENGVESVLGGVGEARLEGGHAGGPVELGGEAADGSGGTSGLRGNGAGRAAALEAQVGGEGGEVGGVSPG